MRLYMRGVLGGARCPACSVVLKVSTGVSAMRQVAPPRDANAVCVATGMLGVSSPSATRIPVLAAVSPKRDSGFWMMANDTPGFRV